MSGGRKRILIVEDERLIAAGLEATLTDLGYEVVGNVPSGEEAVQTAFATSPDLVLMDIQLRGDVDGIQAAARIHDRLDVPVTYLTAYADDETLGRAKITSPFGYVLKPYTERELRAAVEIALYRHDNDRLMEEERAARKAAEEAHEAIRARDEFLQIASHELKTPLTPLQMQLDTLGRALESAGVHEEKLQAKLFMARRQTGRLGRLVESLLDVSRITSGRFVLELEEFDFADMVREVTERFQSEAKSAHSELHVHTEESIPGRWDRLRCEQILSNLLSNAIKYGAGRPVEVTASASEGTVRLSVSDHGIGIQKESLERIFDRFERAVSIRHYGGLGLGLFIARQIAEAHGGSIVAQSEPGIGSTFTSVLPQYTSVRAPMDEVGAHH